MDSENQFNNIVQTIRELGQSRRRYFPVILSTKESEIRVEPLCNNLIDLVRGEPIYITCSKKFADDPALGVRYILFPNDEEFEVLAVGDLLYLDYGKVVLKIEDQITVTEDL